MNCSACGKPGIASANLPGGGFICVRCVKSAKMMPTPAGQPQRMEIRREIWMRLEIHQQPKDMKNLELQKLADCLNTVLGTVQKEIDKRQEESDAAKTEDVSSATALDAPEEEKERSGPVLFNPGVAKYQKGGPST